MRRSGPALAVLLAACGPSFPEVPRPVDYADPRFGSGGWGFAAGSAFPGACVPRGLVKAGPDTKGQYGTLGFLHFSGYWAGDDTVQGFSQLHLHGTGAADYGVLTFMPTDALDPARTTADGYQSKFKKSSELATPGYYAVTLSRGEVRAELTATTRTAHHRYGFPAGAARGVVVVDLAHALGTGRVEDAQLTLSPADGTLRGRLHNVGDMSGRFGGVTVYFEARAKKPWLAQRVWSAAAPFADGTTAAGTGVGAQLEFDVSDGAPVELQVAVSFVDAAGAASNLAAEQPAWDFDGTRARAEAAWNELLSAVRVAGGTEDERRLFYSALHHAFLMPTVGQDADARYRGHDGQVHTASGFTFVGDLSLWDTYRTAHPLYHLVAPRLGRDAVASLTAMAQQAGAFPKWPLATGDTGSMVGASAEVVVADAYLRGVRDFDASGAYGLLRAAALSPTAPAGGRGGRGDVVEYDALGYLPADSKDGTASVTCEYAQDDFALGNLAAALGEDADARRLLARAKGYRKLYDAPSGFLRAKKADGSLKVPAGFAPLQLSDAEYVEANAWHTLFCAPHDAEGLMELLGGQQAFLERLTDFFAKSKEEWESLPADSVLRSLPRPYYWPGNQPDIHAAWLFAQAGRPALTQQWSRWAADTFFRPAPDGLPGNDDGGTMSSWYVFSALGLYPLVGSDVWLVGAPRFPKVTLAVPGGTFTIDAPEASAENLYVQSAELNGQPLAVAELRHADLKPGGRLLFRMGKAPSSWGRR